MRLTGFEAIDFAEQEGLTLNKRGDHIDGPASGLSVAEASAIADDSPDLIWLEVSDGDYYGEPKNMEPGVSRSSTGTKPTTRRAGQLPDELMPGENSDVPQVGDEASGSPSGGIASSGIAGLPEGDGTPGNAELSDDEDPDEPQSGFTGGAVGGTPANKRAKGR